MKVGIVSLQTLAAHLPASSRAPLAQPRAPPLARPLHTRRARCLVCFSAASKQTFGSFDALVSGPTPVLVDFYATWCGPCQMMSEVLKEVSSRMDTVKFVKVDTEKYPSIASRHNVQGLPTLVLFKDGQPVDRIEGFVDAVQLEQRLRYFVSQQ